MIRFDAEAIASATGGRVVRDGGAGPVLTDTRTLHAGAWFLALVGPRFDGHDYVAAAAAAGALGLVSSRDAGWSGAEVRVANTERALQDLGRAARARLGGPVVGITGSAGKTTTRALVCLALSPLGRVHQTVANLNNHLGVPLTLLAGDEDAAATVVEMGTSGPGEIALLADIATPDVRLVINVGPAHLEELGGLDGVATEKGALFRGARRGDVLVVNVDDRLVRAMPRPAGTRVVTYGATEGDLRLASATLVPERLATFAVFDTPAGRLEVEIPAPGTHIAHNAAGALAVAFALGVPLRAAAAALAGYAPVGMRMKAERAGELLVLNDAYNANPTSMVASLGVLAALPGRRVAVLGDMLELGPEEARFHAEVVDAARDLGIDVVICVGPRMAAVSRGLPHYPDAAAAAEAIRAHVQPGDNVLVKGSRGGKLERIVHTLLAEEA